MFPPIYNMREEQLPEQFSVEMHLVTWVLRDQILHDILEHILNMHSLGYGLLAREINLDCRCELTWIRQKIPQIM